MWDRLSKASTLDDIVIITTKNAEDDEIVKLCQKYNMLYFRGSEVDLLDRHFQAAKKYAAEVVVKIPSDCPLTDYRWVDRVIRFGHTNWDRFDYVSNYHPPTFPDGLDIEACKLSILEEAWNEARKDYEREHTFPFIWDQPDRFRIGNVQNPYGDMFLSHRWTLDYEEDYLFIKRVFHEFDDIDFSFEDILDLLDKKPEIEELNEAHKGLNWYRNVKEELRTVSTDLYREQKVPSYATSLDYLKRAKQVIPNATQTLSKGYTQWTVGAAPLFLRSAKGCEVVDVDGNTFIDYGMALGPFILGYSDPDVNLAISLQLEQGTMFTLPHPLETEVAEEIVSIIPCAEMVRFAKNGSDATTAAIKLARAFTNREKVIACGYHGWHDWYIASTERDAGVPAFNSELIYTVKYNDFDTVAKLVAEEKNNIAALIMEPCGAVAPNKGYLENIRELTEKTGIVLIFDELFTGFRWSLGGAQEYFGVTPDLACFGKAMANGMPISCIVGKKSLMECFESVFFSFTYGGETLSLAATLATLRKLQQNNIYTKLEESGKYLQDGIVELIKKHRLQDFLSISGFPFKSVMYFSGNNELGPLEIKTYFQQECAERGVLFIGYHLISLAHTREHLNHTLSTYDLVMGNLKKGIDQNTLRSSIRGKIITQIFRDVGDRSSN
jgi:glutamate-1-semialdehyde 2,1-aminomutase/spore coat polysaccharide biosynthesis protein SpsF